jgi:pyruvate dehydrogenase kinase 2/3/4
MRATRRLHVGSTHFPPIHATVVGNSDTVGIRISDQGLLRRQWLRLHILSNPSVGGGLLTKGITSPSDLFSFSHTRNASRLEVERLVALRTASSHPHGVRATVDEQVKRWKESAPEDDSTEHKAPSSTNHTFSRIGIGLPMGHIYATFVCPSLVMLMLQTMTTGISAEV